MHKINQNYRELLHPLFPPFDFLFLSSSFFPQAKQHPLSQSPGVPPPFFGGGKTVGPKEETVEGIQQKKGPKNWRNSGWVLGLGIGGIGFVDICHC